MVHVAAIDLGATSGRVMLGRVEHDSLELTEVARFEHRPVRVADGLHWSVLGLFGSALSGLARASHDATIESVGVDSWGVDYGLLRQGSLLQVPFSYRDERTLHGQRLVDDVLSQPELYARCGLQRQPFTTVNQLSVDRERGALGLADRMLLLPDLFTYWLTGMEVAERTNASTTGLTGLDRAWDLELASMLGVDASLLPELVDPGSTVGPILESVREHAGIHGMPTVRTVASHDTASAVAAVPMGPRAGYVSSGTWSLVGVEIGAPIATTEALEAGFTNEAGVDGRTRFLKNVMGLWLLSETMRTWEAAGEHVDLAEVLDAAGRVRADVPTFDPTDELFYTPGDMPQRIRSWCDERGIRPPEGKAELVRSILASLAEAYAATFRDAARISGVPVERIHVVGGGSRNALLCQLTADASGLPVEAGPVEATAIGNVLVQARALGAIDGDLEAMREIVRAAYPPVVYEPRTA